MQTLCYMRSEHAGKELRDVLPQFFSAITGPGPGVDQYNDHDTTLLMWYCNTTDIGVTRLVCEDIASYNEAVEDHLMPIQLSFFSPFLCHFTFDTLQYD